VRGECERCEVSGERERCDVSARRREASARALVATQDRVFPHYVPNSSIRHSKSDSKDSSQEIL
jgi:hypothetical protein